MTTTHSRGETEANFLLLLEGLVPLQIMHLRQPGELDRAYRELQAQVAWGPADDLQQCSLLDLMTVADKLTNPGSFRKPADSRTRRRLLSATAKLIAIGALKPGGITWAGRHWCVDHSACPPEGD